jgi:hypothetical protein
METVLLSPAGGQRRPARPPRTPGDFPPPPALLTEDELVLDEDRPACETYQALGQALAATGDIYRTSAHAGGLILASPTPGIDPRPIRTGKELAAVVVDRLRVRVLKGGKSKGSVPPRQHLDLAVASEAFLQAFCPVDEATRSPRYLPTFDLARPGYNDGGPGQRVLYLGKEPHAKGSGDALKRFLDVMEFATPADRTNTVAAALTVLLRNHWPGAKPLIGVTATKSHAGKDTVILFAAGAARQVSISYQATDWALERSFVGALKHGPDTGVVVVENARLARGDGQIKSVFLERVLTDPEPLLFSTGTGPAVRRRNDFVIALSTNEGTVSQDLMNRMLPVHLAPRGNVVDRQSPIGNPKLEYLPAHREEIQAELRGMVERWKQAGRPPDLRVRHPMTHWAQTVGGILLANDFPDFLANYGLLRTAGDPVRRALGELGAERPDKWLRPAEWARLAGGLGLIDALVPAGERGTDAGRERNVGARLKAHDQETFEVVNDDGTLRLRLCYRRRRFDGGEAQTRYCFQVLERTPARAEDDPAPEAPAA